MAALSVSVRVRVGKLGSPKQLIFEADFARVPCIGEWVQPTSYAAGRRVENVYFEQRPGSSLYGAVVDLEPFENDEEFELARQAKPGRPVPTAS